MMEYALGWLTAPSEIDDSFIRRMGESGDASFVPVLADLLFFRFVIPRTSRDPIRSALTKLTGENFAAPGWRDWFIWLGRHPEVVAPPEYADWKSQLFQRIDPRISLFFYDGVKARIRLEEIVWGGVAKDGIPDLTDAPVIPASEATYLNPDDRVFGVSINGEHRAYPLRILNPHEMANDVVGGEPIALAYWTLCGSGIVYSAKLNGERVTFGTSGLLYLSNKLMYDRKTNTLWRQFTGEPVVGSLADSGIRLSIFPVVVTLWHEWVTAHPDTTVLDIETGIYRSSDYLAESDPRSIYYDYFNSVDTMFPVWLRSSLLDTKTVVLGLRVEGQAKAYPLDKLAESPVVNDELGGVALVIVTDPEAGAARAYHRGDRRFEEHPAEAEDKGPRLLLDQGNSRWEVTEEALLNVEDPSLRLERLPGHMAFWFGWYASFPLTLVYGEP